MSTASPTLLLIHGFLDDATVWDGLIGSLADEVAVVRYDLPGFGTRSGAVGDACAASLESLAAEAEPIVTGIDGPVVVVGQSLGTQVAELVAATHPERVLGLVLLTPVPLSGTQLPDEVVAPFRALGGDRDAQRAVRAELSPHLSEDQLDRLADTGAVVAPDVIAHYVDLWNAGVPNTPAVSAYGGPVLVVRGGADAFVTEQLLRAIVPRFTDVGVKVVDAGGHWVHVEFPDSVASMILDFAESITGVTS
ncbi:MAG TPA: alpha/beta fold hydrolase [Mycobacterium sp.]|nr:alpha/beta fold hydrolase [Mycobacterium sp.]